MTNKQILIKAIKKAERGGFNRMGNVEKFAEAFQYSCKELLFNHDFAKAFWGERVAYDLGDGLANMEAWEFHLSIMVLEEEPLKYIEKYL